MTTQNKNNKDRLKDLSEKIKKFESNSKKEENNIDSENNSSYLTLGIDFCSTIFVASFLGYEIDKYFDSKPWIFIIFFILGFITAIYNIFRKNYRGK